MTPLLRATRAEWSRVAGGRAVLALPAAALLGAGYAWALAAAAERGVLGARSGFYVAAAAASGAGMVCAAIGALAAAGGVAGDLAGGLARSVFVRPLPRSSWLAGRLAAISVGTACLFLSACAGAMVAGLARFGLAGTVEGEQGEYLIAGAGFLARQLAVGLLISLLAQTTAVAVGGGLGAVVGRPAAAGAAVVVTVAVLSALARWPATQAWLPAPVVTESLDRVAELAQGIASRHAEDGAGPRVAVCLLWLGAALGAGATSLARRDIVS